MALLRNLVLASALILATTPTQAGFTEALSAYQSKDYAKAMAEAQQASAAGDARGSYLVGALYQGGLGVGANAAEAFNWYTKAARGGVVGAFNKLAWAHLRGEGTGRDMEKALGVARVAAKAGDAEGQFLVYLALTLGPLRYINDAGKPDDAKYKQLAARPVAERTADSEAYDALYTSADKGYPMAALSLAMLLGGTIGENNTERMLILAKRFPDQTNQGLRNYEKAATYMASRGKTLTSPQLFFDTNLNQHLIAAARTCGVKPKSGETARNVELKAIAIAKPLESAVYLPTQVPGHQHTYLVKGDWEEDWTYVGCDKTAVIRIKFSADGLGGAHFHSVTEGKDILGLTAS